jgi:hypothetical protein
MYILQLMAVTQFTNDVSTIPGWADLPAGEKAYYRTTPDSVAYLKWTGVAVEKFPSSLSFWRQRAAALKTFNRTDDALAAFRRIAQLDPTDFASRIQAGQILTDKAGVVIDSLGRLAADTTALKANRSTWEPIAAQVLAEAEPVLVEATALATAETKVNVAVLYFTAGSKLVQSKLRPDLGITWLERAIALDAQRQLYTQANFFMGLAYLYRIQTMDLQGFIDRKSCAGMAELETVVTRGKAAITAGASVQPETAKALTGVFTNLEKTPPQARKAWECR